MLGLARWNSTRVYQQRIVKVSLRFQSTFQPSSKNDTSNASPPHSTQTPQIGSNSSAVLTTSTPVLLDKNSIFVISLPITTKQSFIYCNHRPGILSKTQASKIELVTKIEAKLVNLATKGWNKLTTSKLKINIKITHFIKQLLDTIPYKESCLRSFPNKNAMIREINEESLHLIKPTKKSENEKENKNKNKNKNEIEDGNVIQSKSTGDTKTDIETARASEISSQSAKNEGVNPRPTVIVQSEVQNLDIPTNQLKPIPLYHPQFQSPSTIREELQEFRDHGLEHEKKWAIICAIGIPITLPFALVPVVPNVPGFYVAYRLYCHIKALYGIRNLDYLLEHANGQDYSEKSVATLDTAHLNFKPLKVVDDIYKKNAPSEVLQRLSKDYDGDDEAMVITKDVIEELTAKLDMDNYVKDELMKALHQETKRLGKQLKMDDQVE